MIQEGETGTSNGDGFSFSDFLSSNGISFTESANTCIMITALTLVMSDQINTPFFELI